MKKITAAVAILIASNLLMAQNKKSPPVIHAHSRATSPERSADSGAVAAVLSKRSSSTSTASELAKVEHQKAANHLNPAPVQPGAAASNKNNPKRPIPRSSAGTARRVAQPRST